MYPEATSIQQLAEYLKYLRTTHYRCMIEHQNGEFQVTRLIVGPQTPWTRYDYGDVLFLAGEESGETVANWLLSGTFTNRLHNSFPIVPMQTGVYSNRHPSHAFDGTFTFSKPFTSYQVSFSQIPARQDHVLASEDAPFFPALWEAERHLLYGIPEGSHKIQAPQAAVYVYIEHPDAWLERIHFSLTALELHLEGQLLPGTKLKVAGSGIVGYDDYPTQNTVSIPLPNGRPDFLKIALIRGNMCIDYFVDDKASQSNPLRQKRTNVTFAAPAPQEQVQELIDHGEGKTIEFKYELKSSEKMSWLKTIAAFANGDGGSLIIGVNDKDGAVVGIYNNLKKYNGSIAKFKDEIENAIKETIAPLPEYDFVDATIEGHPLLVVNVQTTLGKCYAAYHGQIPVYYMRRGATTIVADHHEVQELINAKAAYALSLNRFNPLFSYGDIQMERQ